MRPFAYAPMRGRIGVITNCRAKKIQTGRASAKRMAEIVEGGSAGQAILTREISEIEPTLESFARERINILVTNGGDGTAHKVVDTLIKKGYHSGLGLFFLPLPSGTQNVLCRNVGKGRNPTRRIERIVQAVREEKILPLLRVETVKVEIEKSGETLYGFFFSTGAPYRILEKYYEEPRPGFLPAAKVIFVHLWGAFLRKEESSAVYGLEKGPLAFEDGTSGPARHMLVVASSLRQLVLWFSPFRHKRKEDGLNLLCVSAPVSHFFNPKNFILGSFGRLEDERILSRNVHAFSIEECRGFALDGEIYPLKEPSSLRISTGPAIVVPFL